MELLRRFRSCLKAAEPKMELENLVFFSCAVATSLILGGTSIFARYQAALVIAPIQTVFSCHSFQIRIQSKRTPINDQAWQKQTSEFIVVTSIYLINFLNYFLLPPRSPIVSWKLRSIFSFLHNARHDFVVAFDWDINGFLWCRVHVLSHSTPGAFKVRLFLYCSSSFCTPIQIMLQKLIVQCCAATCCHFKRQIYRKLTPLRIGNRALSKFKILLLCTPPKAFARWKRPPFTWHLWPQPFQPES